MTIEPAPVKEVKGARVLALFGDSITTDHISPAGNIKPTAPAGVYLLGTPGRAEGFQFLWLAPRQSRSDGARHLRQYPHPQRNDGRQGRRQHRLLSPTSPAKAKRCRIFDAAQRYKEAGLDTVVVGGKEYGTGSSRDWAAKGPKLLGVRAVITESFERIHRSNLIGMGVAPFCFEAGKSRKDYNLTGREMIDIPGLSGDLKPPHAGRQRPSIIRTASTATCRWC